MLFFDLEFYVPPQSRKDDFASLILNPANPMHTLMGGCFYSKELDAPVDQQPSIDHLWIWDYSDEAALLREIQKRFEQEWDQSRKVKEWILSKPARDLVVCGAGISKVDLPALFCRSVVNKIADPTTLFNVFLKTRPIDLANVGSFLFPEESTLYPKTTKEIASRLGFFDSKGSSKNVWLLYEQGDRSLIAQRTQAELLTVLKIYTAIRSQIKKDS